MSFPEEGGEAVSCSALQFQLGCLQRVLGSESPLINPGRRDSDKIEGRVFTQGPSIPGGSAGVEAKEHPLEK